MELALSNVGKERLSTRSDYAEAHVQSWHQARSPGERCKVGTMRQRRTVKANKAEAEEGKATAEGELETTTKMLADSKKELATTQAVCMQTAADYEAPPLGSVGRGL